ncbi:hypothetical protein [Streptomyces sp. TLI_105]|uniref:hypothetical protein n=1 Tax=Streptomyces sp. TLI_105 TaxID=1881019 RepID=UPI0008956A90|nr:hypothetical protein [Streptomyces sp. TLI_105]SEC02252.1 hypothetical protein SAMN05428939_1358 [Streptomyces sp. TLI_105]
MRVSLRGPRRPALRAWIRWTAGFLAFPIAGLAGRAAAGPVDDAMSALVGGVVTGAVIGAGQALVSSGRLSPPRWSAATAVGGGLGLLLGAALVGHRTDLGSLALMGAVEGVLLGAAQARALPSAARLPWLWAAAMPVLWAAGWTVTTLAGVGVDARFTVFGATGALTFSAFSGVLLHRLLPPTAPSRVTGSNSLREVGA